MSRSTERAGVVSYQEPNKQASNEQIGGQRQGHPDHDDDADGLEFLESKEVCDYRVA